MAKKKLADLTTEVGITMKQFDRGIASVEKRLKALTKPVTVKVLGDAKGITSAVSGVTKRLKELKTTKVKLDVDTRPAASSVSRLQSQLNRLRMPRLTANVRGMPAAGGAARAAGAVAGGGGGGGVGLAGAGGIGAVGLAAGAGAAAAAAGMAYSLKTAQSLETMLIKLRKASDVGDAGFAKLKGDLFDLSTTMKGVSIENLLDIATTGAKLGIASKDLVEYSRGVAMVAGAMDDIPAAQVADEIGKLNVVFKLGIQGTQQLGSAIDKVADSGVSSASGILNVTQRTSGSAKAAKISAQESIAYAGALLDTGTNAELAASAILRLFQSMNSDKGQEGMARVLGLTKEQFAKKVKEGPAAALNEFLAKVKTFDARGQQNAFGALGIKGGQGVGELQKLAEQIDSVRKYTGMANDEFKTLNQLNQGYQLSSGSSESAAAQFGNQIKRLADRIGGMLLPAFNWAMEVGSSWAAALRGAMDTVEIGLGHVWDAIQKFPSAFEAAFGPEVTGMIAGAGNYIRDSIVGAVEMVGVVIRNLPDFMEIAVVRFQEMFTNIGIGISTTMANFAKLGSYIADQWVNMIIDGFNSIGHVIINLGKSLADFGIAFAKFMWNPSKGFQFDPTPLMEGFKAETEKLPALLEPQYVDFNARIGAIVARVGEQEAARTAGQVGPAAGVGGESGKNVPDLGALEKKVGDPEATFDDPKKKKAKNQGGTTNLESFYSLLQDQLHASKDPTQQEIARNGREMARDMKELVKLNKNPKPATAVGPA